MLKSKLYWKVLANFGLLLIILTAMTVLTLIILAQIEKSFNVAASSIKALQDIERVRQFVNDVPDAAQEYAFSPSARAKATYENGWKDFDAALNNLQRDLADSASLRDLKQLRVLYFGWMENVGDRLIRLGDERQKKGRVEDVDALLKEVARVNTEIGYIPQARQIIRALYRDRLARQPSNFEAATARTTDLAKYIALVNVLLAIFALVLGFVLTRSITKPIQLLKEGTQDIMAGRFEPIVLHRSDELGDLAADFNRMSALLGNNYTRLNAYSELVTTLNSSASIDEVQEKSLQILCRHTRAAVGALYILNRDERVLELASGFALKSNEQVKKRLALGEGIPGQCAAQGKTLEIDEISTNSSFMIDTGLVELVPSYVTAVPIAFRDEILGVLVLGATRKFGELEREIVSNSVPQLGVAITNAKNYDATRKLSIEIAKRNEELSTKNAEIEKAYRVKSDFLSSMSHELRTPLNSIIGFSSVLLGSTADPVTNDQRMALEKILKNGRHLLQLINDILDLSKLESGRMALSVESEDINSIVSNCLLIVEPLIQSKKLTLKQEIQPNLPKLTTDIVKVRQIVVNLLSNAAKFTEKGGISVNVTQRPDGMIAFAVKDSGIGIEKKNFEVVFEEFKQVDSSSTRKYKGTGLGLPISRRLARMLGGDLTIESEYGHGSTFTLAIPPTLPPLAAESAMKVLGRPEMPQAGQAPKQAYEAGVVAGQGVQVLCIDDDPDVIEILRKYLVPEGYSVAGALSGDEGIELATKVKPALITLDIMMPKKDGWQVLRELKQNAATRDIPVIIHSIVDNKPLAMSLGAVDVMTKPTEPKRLLALVKKYYQTGDQFILLVDDHLDFALACKDLLKRDGFEVRIASSGPEALAILKDSTPSLILLDLMMPGMDGFRVIQELDRNQKWRQIPVVAMSPKELTEAEEKELRSRTVDLLVKDTFSTADFSKTIKRILGVAH
jgi:signal transduction histidine kinase/DNA-binding response OmpR family regulator/HAMP domain-containing protein